MNNEKAKNSQREGDKFRIRNHKAQNGFRIGLKYS